MVFKTKFQKSGNFVRSRSKSFRLEWFDDKKSRLREEFVFGSGGLEGAKKQAKMIIETQPTDSVVITESIQLGVVRLKKDKKGV